MVGFGSDSSGLSIANLGPAGRLALEVATVGENEVWFSKAPGTEAGERSSEPLTWGTGGAH